VLVVHPKNEASIAGIENNVDERLRVGAFSRQLFFQNQPQPPRWIVSDDTDHDDDNEKYRPPSH